MKYLEINTDGGVVCRLMFGIIDLSAHALPATHTIIRVHMFAAMHSELTCAA